MKAICSWSHRLVVIGGVLGCLLFGADSSLARPGITQIGGFGSVSDVALGEDGRVVVVDGEAGQVQVINPDGSFGSKFSTGLKSRVALGGDRIYLAGSGVSAYGVSGSPVGSFGTGRDFFDVSFRQGSVYALESNAQKVQQFSGEGLDEGSVTVNCPSGVPPLALAVGPEGRHYIGCIAVPGLGESGIRAYGPQGAVVDSFGTGGWLSLPGALVGDGSVLDTADDGTLFVVSDPSDSAKASPPELLEISPQGSVLARTDLWQFSGGQGTVTSIDVAGDKRKVVLGWEGTENLVTVVDWDRLESRSDGPDGVSINNGDLYTNDPEVTLSVRWPAYAQQMKVSNDGGFQPATDADLTGSFSWKLRSSGPERLPKTVYVRFEIRPGQTVDFTDDIILDQTPPVVTALKQILGAGASSSALRLRTSASASRVRSKMIRVRARDNNSGVSKMQITKNKRRPGKAVKFRSKVKAKGKVTWIRVQDRARNWSKWKKVTLKKPSRAKGKR